MAPPRKKVKLGHKQQARQQSRKELEDLEQAVASFTGPAALFDELPISNATKKGLKSAFYTKLTSIQAKALPLALRGKDVLGAARTGSGKTLAFLIPVLEVLLRKKWGPNDGLGALIISPTRELAVQIFEVLRKIGHQHQFSAGLVIGGKDLKSEKDRLGRMNILVATPGRLLQHMDQTLGFETDQLQILVLDEADRILDMGFSTTLNAIVANLPQDRQTLLFSATQTKSVKDLARLSLKDPEYVAARETGANDGTKATGDNDDEQAAHLETPQNLEQHYVVVHLDKKIDMLWSFVKTHLFAKTIVFLSSGKQVRFVYENFRHLRPGVPLLHMLGKQKQKQRLDIYQRFLAAKHAVLFATDIAARGLDFPAVDWVVQVDCPEDVETYIHRVGRTSRYESKGKALLFLLPSEEEGMTKRFEAKRIPIEKVKTNAQKQQSIQGQLQSSAFQYPEMKFLAQKAFISYVRSVHLQRDKTVFDLAKLDLDKFAASLGLAGAPRIHFTSKEEVHKAKNAVLALQNSASKADSESENSESGSAQSDDEDQSSDYDSDASVDQHGGVAPGSTSDSGSEDSSAPKSDAKTKAKVVTKYDRMFARKPQTVLSEHYRQLVKGQAPDEDADDDFLSLRRKDHALDDADLPESSFLSKRALKRGVSKKANLSKHGNPQKIVFNEAGEATDAYELLTEQDFAAAGDVREQQQQFVQEEQKRLAERDLEDKQRAKEKRKAKLLKRKRGVEDAANEQHQYIAPVADEADDGYVSPDFDLSEDEPDSMREKESGLEDLALQMLKRK